jgi:hypothetical protein
MKLAMLAMVATMLTACGEKAPPAHAPPAASAPLPLPRASAPPTSPGATPQPAPPKSVDQKLERLQGQIRWLDHMYGEDRP